MPLDVIMPALGMAQDTGLIVAWHKQPGEPVAKGDVLFEVETDKATMEVEAQGDGYLTDVTAQEGTDVPVGNVIARISEDAKGAGDTSPTAPASEALPEGKAVIMPTLGMAQDTGLLVNWHKAAGDAVSADDVLFEVETDKSTMEVPAGVDGYVAALLAEAGEDLPVGQTIAIISDTAPSNPITRASVRAETPATPPKADIKPAASAPAKKTAAPVKPAAGPSADGRVLASPKLRRLAKEQGLDLSRLAAAGYPQPYHVKDLDTLKSLPTQAAQGAAPSACRLTAELETDGFADFAVWAAKTADLTDTTALLAGFCAASLGHRAIVAVNSFGQTSVHAAETNLGNTTPNEDAPQIRVRDLRFSPITTVQVGADDIPTITLTKNGAGLTITLEYASGQFDADAAITLLSNFAGRMEQPLRHLL